MVLVVIIFALASIKSLHSWDIIENEQYSFLKNWGIHSVEKPDGIINKFKKNEVETSTCEALHRTSEAPFTAIILFKTSGRLMCMGSIIDQYHILSSRRCFEKSEVGDLLVLVGYFKPWWGRYSQIRSVKKIVRHEYELSILQLKKKLKFTDYVKPVRLPESFTKSKKDVKSVFGTDYKVVGFNVDRYDVPADYVTKDKLYQIAQDKFFDFKECSKNYTKIQVDKVRLFCTLGNATYCWGARGSPVLIWLGIYFVQVGVVIAENCTVAGRGPLLVCRTDFFGDWIRTSVYYGHQPR